MSEERLHCLDILLIGNKKKTLLEISPCIPLLHCSGLPLLVNGVEQYVQHKRPHKTKFAYSRQKKRIDGMDPTIITLISLHYFICIWLFGKGFISKTIKTGGLFFFVCSVVCCSFQQGHFLSSTTGNLRQCHPFLAEKGKPSCFQSHDNGDSENVTPLCLLNLKFSSSGSYDSNETCI